MKQQISENEENLFSRKKCPGVSSDLKWYTGVEEPKRFKGLYLSKALTCMKIYLYKQELIFCQQDGYFWPHCCMNNLYISHRSLYTPTYSF